MDDKDKRIEELEEQVDTLTKDLAEAVKNAAEYEKDRDMRDDALTEIKALTNKYV